MGIAERREREKEALRTLILEAARDILSEEGLDGLSMRAIADRIEYSPATIYLYFRDKNELIRDVVLAGFQRMHVCMREELACAGGPVNAAEEFAVLGRAYARFALENTAYFRVMFELPSVPQLECGGFPEENRGVADPDGKPFDLVVSTVEEAMREGTVSFRSAESGALFGWGLIHGLTSLYLGGHLREKVRTNEEFLALIEEAQRSMYEGWGPRGAEPAGVETVDFDVP